LATQTKSSAGKRDTAFVPSVEETIERIRALNEKILESGKTMGGAWLDTYEKALHNVLDFETQVANASELDWVSAVAKAQAEFVTDITSAYTKAARELLSRTHRQGSGQACRRRPRPCCRGAWVHVRSTQSPRRQSLRMPIYRHVQLSARKP
jgi:hypothetical protein